jgi:putative MATE family efflux protein
MRKEKAVSQYDRMMTTPVWKLVVELGLPTTVSMLVSNIYNVADTYFVGQVGTSASGAIGVVFALMAIIQAIGFMLGHGAGSHIARQLGAKKVEEASTYASTSFFLALSLGSLITIIGLCNLDRLCLLLGSTGTILPYARVYATYVLCAAPAMTVSCVTNNILRYEGRALFAMIGLTLGGLLNIFGDWLLMGTHFRMGVAGAGLATLLSQYISAIVLTGMFLRGKTQSKLSVRLFARKWHVVADIVAVGSPSLARQGLNSISTMILNICAGSWGDAAVAAMAIVGKITNFLFCVAVGIGQGFQPVSAYNYGAKNYKRVRDAFRFAVAFSTVLLSVIGIFGFSFASSLVRWMRDDDLVVAIGTFALRACCVSLPFLAVSIVGNMLFQSIGKAGQALFLASLRSGLCFIPVLLILTKAMGLRGVEISQPLSNLLSFCITIPCVVHFFHTLPKQTSV